MITNYTLEQLEALSEGTLMNSLGITYTELGDDFVSGKMPVDGRTKQPVGILHGGANGALIETLASMGTYMLIDHKTQYAAGLELNVNHIKSMTEGFVYGKAVIVHKGRNTHVWQVDIKTEEGKLVATGRMTMFVYKIDR
jgi:1,4-dihydroxy-2-naphthoyl-CoA hydrolase